MSDLKKYAIIQGNDVINVIEYESDPGNPPPGFEDGIIAVQSDVAGPGWTYESGQFVEPPMPAPTPKELLDRCKQKAQALLYQTDWSEIPSVNNTSNTPHLLNQQDFLDFRNAVRALVVEPVETPTFPAIPTAQWSK